MKSEKEPERPKGPVYCYECGREILPEDAYEYIGTRRGTRIYIHQKCFRRKQA